MIKRAMQSVNDFSQEHLPFDSKIGTNAMKLTQMKYFHIIYEKSASLLLVTNTEY